MRRKSRPELPYFSLHKELRIQLVNFPFWDFRPWFMQCEFRLRILHLSVNIWTWKNRKVRVCILTAMDLPVENSEAKFSQLWTCRCKFSGLNSQNSCFQFLNIQAQNSSKIILAFHSACHADAATVWVLSSQVVIIYKLTNCFSQLLKHGWGMNHVVTFLYTCACKVNNYTPENSHTTWKWTPGKGESRSGNHHFQSSGDPSVSRGVTKTQFKCTKKVVLKGQSHIMLACHGTAQQPLSLKPYFKGGMACGWVLGGSSQLVSSQDHPPHFFEQYKDHLEGEQPYSGDLLTMVINHLQVMG